MTNGEQMKRFHGVHEVRMFRPNGIAVGYFDNLGDALRVIENEPSQYKACYLTLNPVRLPASIPVNPQSLMPSKNSAGDTDIERRVRLLVDLDAPRPAGTNSNETEKQSARDQADGVRAYLKTRGWPEPMLADSGNGWHLNYRIDLPNDANATALVKGVLEHLKRIFPMVDAGNFNASRVCKLYGTWARKGEHSDLRPHRKSAVIEEGSDGIVTEEQLRALAPVPAAKPEVTPDKSNSNGQGLQELIRFLEFYEIPTRSDPREVRGGWQIEIECPWMDEHSGEAARDTVVSFVNGFGFKCLHSHCVDRHWQEFRAEWERRTGKVFLFNTPTDVIVPAENTPVSEKPIRPQYPDDVWVGTIAYEFARACTLDNNIPPKLFIEAFRTFLAAAWGDRVQGPYKGMESARAFTAIIAPAGKGKGEAVRTADDFFEGMKEIVAGCPTVWRPKGIGAANAAFASVPGLNKVIIESKDFRESNPHLSWGSTTPRVITVQEELKSFLSSLFIEGGVGTDLEGVICALWDGVRFHSKATGERPAVYGAVQLSLLGGIPPKDWFEILGQGDIMSSGFFSRLNLIGTEGDYAQVAKINRPVLYPLQGTLLPRLEALAVTPVQMTVDSGADGLLEEWVKTLPADTVRLNIHAMRSAMVLAWLRGATCITPEIMAGAIRLGDYQLASRQFYRVTHTKNMDAAIEGAIKKYVGTKGPAKKWDAGRGINYKQYGVGRFTKAWDNLVHAGVLIAPQGNDTRYGLAEGEEW